MKTMTVVDKMIAAGFDPVEAMECWGGNDVECAEIEIRMTRCRPDGYTDAIMVCGCGCHPYSDGTIRPAPSWYGDEVTMLFRAETAPFNFRENPFRV